MANRRPLIINPAANQIQEVTDSDSLIGNGVIPLGGIIMWSGSSVPTGFTLCNTANGGSVVNGITIPDLEDKFIIGAKEYSSGWKTQVTGSATAGGGDKDAVLIAHRHDLEVLTDAGGGSPNGTVDQNPTAGRATQNSANSISLTGIDASGSASTTQTGTNANLPPYFALAFIIRTL